MITDMASASIAKDWVGGLGRFSERLAQAVKGEPTTLLMRAQQGDAVAVERLIELYQDTIYSMAVSFTRDPHQAEDLAQEAWIKILRGLPRFRHDSKFSTWLYRITMNTFLNATRAVKREQEVVGSLAGESEAAAPHVEATLDVHEAVRALPEEFRSVVLLRYVADLSYKEIASVLELPLGTVQSRLKRALDKLESSLGHHGYSLGA
jgi:RNA polymerase sigma-70 factor (ECF subfamily)